MSTSRSIGILFAGAVFAFPVAAGARLPYEETLTLGEILAFP